MKVTDEQLEHWITHGFVVLPGFLTGDEAARAHDEVLQHLPSLENVRAQPQRTDVANGLGYSLFPYSTDLLNHISLHPDLLDAATRLFEGRAPFLTQSVLRGSYAGMGDVDQNLHRDFTDNSLLVPSDAPAFRQMAAMLYYTDVTVDTAPLYVCDRLVTDDLPAMPRERMRDVDLDVYAAERPVEMAAGGAVLYSMGTFHRGSKFTTSDGYRFAHHIVMRPAGNEWMAWQAWPRRFDSDAGTRCMATLTIEQRGALGVPPPGHEFWTETTVEGFGLRYPGVDLAPYRPQPSSE